MIWTNHSIGSGLARCATTAGLSQLHRRLCRRFTGILLPIVRGGSGLEKLVRVARSFGISRVGYVSLWNPLRICDAVTVSSVAE
jgi:hypothetical protein